MNFQPLFTTSRVVTELYRIASTVLLLYYLVRYRRNRSEAQPPHDRYRDDNHAAPRQRRWPD